MKKICYVGENNDYSDKWLIERLSDDYIVEIISPDQYKRIPKNQADVCINRLYVSSLERYGTNVIAALRDKLKLVSPMINSNTGWELESDRISQYNFFTDENFNYVSTSIISIENINSQNLNQFPIVIKKNISGRNKILPVARDKHDLKKFIKNPYDSNQLVVQPLIDQKICYRTEFVGPYTWTYRQHIKIKGFDLSFSKENTSIHNPADARFYQRLIKLLNRKKIKCFSVEYFIDKNEVIIIDYNMTSNYSEILINNIGQQLILAWKEIIKNEI